MHDARLLGLGLGARRRLELAVEEGVDERAQLRAQRRRARRRRVVVDERARVDVPLLQHRVV